MKAVIFCEAGKKIGYGHLSRCIALYDELCKRKIQTKFYIYCDISLRKILGRRKHSVINWLRSKEKFQQLVNKADIGIIDSYLADKFFYDTVSDLTKVCLFIDDTNRITYPKGIILNPVVNTKNHLYPDLISNHYLLGLKFALIKKEFKSSKNKKIKEIIKNILIIFGGTDYRNLTEKITKHICINFRQINLAIVAGNNSIRKILQKKITNRKVKILINPGIKKIKNVMENTDLAISAGGQTILELASLGVPTTAILVAENQKTQIKALAKLGVVEYAGDWDDTDLLNKIITKIDKLKTFRIREKISKIAQNTVDTNGSSRVVDLILKKIENQLVIRRVKSEDCLPILKLANEPEVRNSSFQSEKILLKKHIKWCKDKLGDKKHIFLVAELKKQIIGQIRFQVLKDDAIISISVSKKFRKKGIGREMWINAVEFIKKNYQKIKKIKAIIREENSGSINFFKSLGFTFIKSVIINKQKGIIYEKKI